jgi:hypothetical protein
VRILDDPKVMARVHGVLALVWLILAILTTVWGVIDQDNRLLIAWLIFMSGYANAASHWGARQGAAPSAKEGA